MAYADALQCVLMALGIVIIGVVTLFFVGGWDRLMAGIAALSQADPVHTPDGYSHYIAVPGIIQLVPDGALAVGGAWTAAMILTYLLAVMAFRPRRPFPCGRLPAEPRRLSPRSRSGRHRSALGCS